MRQFKPGQLQTGSIYPISASYALTASYVSGSVSIDTGSLVTTASFNAYTGSQSLASQSFDSRINSLTGSINILTSSYNSFTSSYTTGSFTGSFTGTLIGTASWANNAVTASFITASNVVGTVTSSSYALSASFLIGGVTIDTGSLVTTSSFNSFTSSINSFTSSYNTGSFTGSFRGDGSQLTGTSKWTGSNPISRNSNVEITGSLIVSQGYISIENFNGESRISLNSDEVAAIDYAANHYAALSVDGTLTLKTNISESYLRNSNVTNPNVILEFPNKTAGSYTITTTDDLNPYTTTSSFNSFTSSIQGQVDSLTAATSSYLLTNNTASMLAPYVLTSSTSSMTVLSSSFANTASFVTASNIYGPYGSNSVVSSSYALSSSNAVSASFASTASFITASGVIGTVTSASYAVSSSFSTTASYATFAETASSATNAQDILVYVQNNSGYNIAKGVVVHITASGNSSDIPRIVSASYENDANSANTLGITYQDIANGSQGYVMTEGVLRGIDTTNFTSGQLIYLGASGSIIGSAPQAPLHAVRLGQVVREQENNGSIYININNGYELDELHDVRITTASLSYGDLLMRSSSVWINSKQLSGSYALTGSLTATSFTGSLFGTASWSENAITASFITASNVIGTVTSASYAVSASYLIGGITIDTGSLVSTSSFNTFTSSIQSQVNSLTSATASYVLISQTSSMLAPYVLTSSTSSMTVLSASFANTASFVTASNVVGTVTSASYAVTASYAMNGGGGGVTYIRRSDYTSSLDPNVNYLYLGDAVTGSLESSPVWDISRLSISSSGATLTQTTSSAAWTDRYTVTYL